MADKITITEALAELKTIGKRLDKKHETIQSFLVRQERFKDPLEKDGGSLTYIRRELQSIRDLHQRVINIRSAISSANSEEAIIIDGDTRPIQDWLVWRREIAPKLQALQTMMRRSIDAARREAASKGLQVTSPGEAKQPTDVIVNLNEQELATDIERLESTLGRLDGLLSLKNATVIIEIE